MSTPDYPTGWTDDTRDINTKPYRGFVHESHSTIALYRVESGYEVVFYPEKCADYIGFVENHGVYGTEENAMMEVRNVMADTNGQS